MIKFKLQKAIDKILGFTVLKLNRVVSFCVLVSIYYCFVLPYAFLTSYFRGDPLQLKFKKYSTLWNTTTHIKSKELWKWRKQT